MHIYLENIPAEFHPDPIWNDGALGFFENNHPIRKWNKMSSDIRSVADLKLGWFNKNWVVCNLYQYL